jgi:16S rRNA (cytosine967-C5)-methyltransferase
LAGFAGRRDRQAFRAWVYDVVRWTFSLDAFTGGNSWAQRLVALAGLKWEWDIRPLAKLSEYMEVDKIWFEALERQRVPWAKRWSELQGSAQTTQDISLAWAMPPQWLGLMAAGREPRDLAKIARVLSESAPTTATSFAKTGPGERARYSAVSFHAVSDVKILESEETRFQDEGSALVALFAAESAESVLDFCAGSGGKTFILSHILGAEHVAAWDAERPEALQIPTRVQVFQSREGLDANKGRFQVVLCDVPCSLSGTMRRHPEVRLRNPQSVLAETLLRQQSILDDAARFVRPGGYLLYATCSVLRAENEDQIRLFLASHPEFSQSAWHALPSRVDASFLEIAPLPSPSVTIEPQAGGPDGFYIHRLKKS